MSAASSRYVGTWDLVPEVCVYDEGAPPQEATYRIDEGAGRVSIRLSWRPSASAEVLSTEFAGPVDGDVRPFSAAPGVTGISFTRVDDLTLDTAAWNDGILVSSARRAASADGDLLVVVQSSPRPDGGAARIFQVYRRRPEAAQGQRS